MRIHVGGTGRKVAVPDLATVCRLDAAEPSKDERLRFMQMIYGGQLDAWDFRKAGFDEEVPTDWLGRAGFVAIRRGASFGLFDDASEAALNGTPISLNVECRKP